MTLGGIFICAVLESINRDPKLSPDHESIFPDAEIESDQCVSENDLSSLSIARRIASLTPHRFYFKKPLMQIHHKQQWNERYSESVYGRFVHTKA